MYETSLESEETLQEILLILFLPTMIIIEDVQIHSPLGKSDHTCISFVCDIEEVVQDSTKTVYKHEKANYLLMKQRFNMDWTDFLDAETNTETKWTRFKNKSHRVILECVPKKEFKHLCNKRRTNENLPMNRKLWTKIKRKQRL